MIDATDTIDEIAAKLGITRDEVLAEAERYIAAIRREYAWPADGVMPDDYDKTLLHRINEAVLSKLEALPGMHNHSSGWCMQEAKCDLGFEHQPSGWWVEVTMAIRPNPDWDEAEMQKDYLTATQRTPGQDAE